MERSEVLRRYVKLLHHFGMSRKEAEFSIQFPSQSCGSNLLHGTSALVGLLQCWLDYFCNVLDAFLRDYSVACASSSALSSVGIKSSSSMLGFSHYPL